MEARELFVAAGQVLLAVFSALVRWLNAKDRRRQTMFALLGDASAAVLSGILVYAFFYRYLEVNVFLCFCLAALFGLGGAEGVEKIESIVYKKAGIEEGTGGGQT